MRHLPILAVVPIVLLVLSVYQEQTASVAAPPPRKSGKGHWKAEKHANELPPLRFSSTDALRDLAELECKPLFFGYSWEEGEALFPAASYPHCRDRFAQIPPSEFDVSKQTFTLDCPANATGKVALGPNDQSFMQLKDAKRDISAHVYSGPETFTHTQDFAFATCRKDTKDFEVVHYRPRYSPWLHHNVRKAAKPKSDRRAKPLAVVMLTLDSFSRRHFYQKLPETVALLESLRKGSQHAVFDFQLHNVQGANSVQNMVPLFTDGGDFMWEQFAEEGFITLLGLEDCDPGFDKHITPSSHYFMRAFFCAAFLYSPYNSEKKNKLKQRCIGPKMSHEYALDYISEFSEMYKDVSQWISVHLNTAHEATGRHAQLLDPDLSEFLRRFLRDRGATHELVIVLHGDHGMRYGAWKNTARAHQEHILPALFLVASHSLLKAIDGSYAHLLHNTHALTTKKDIRKTLLQLLDFPRTRKLRPDSGDFYSLFTQVIPLTRSCEDADIPEWLCCCAALEDLDPAAHSQLLSYFATEALSFANVQVYASTEFPPGYVCEALTLESVESAAHTALTSHESYYTVEFSTPTLARFSADFYMRDIAKAGKNEPKSWLAEFPFARVRTRFAVKLLGLERLDPYAGMCEHISRSVGLEAKWCVCGDLELLRLRQPELYLEASDLG